jgi:hypothetical protein
LPYFEIKEELDKKIENYKLKNKVKWVLNKT